MGTLHKRCSIKWKMKIIYWNNTLFTKERNISKFQTNTDRHTQGTVYCKPIMVLKNLRAKSHISEVKCLAYVLCVLHSVFPRVIMKRTPRVIFSKSYIKSKSDCIYHFPIDLEQQTDTVRFKSTFHIKSNGKMVNAIWFWFNLIRFLCM